MNVFQNTITSDTYTSFGGSDIACVIGSHIVATLQAISYSVTREKGPIYTMRQSADPLAFARGKRAIAGSLVFLTIDEQALLQHMRKVLSLNFYQSKSDHRYDYSSSVGVGDSIEDLFAVTYDPGTSVDPLSGSSYADIAQGAGKGPGYERSSQAAMYPDQILPFDVHVSASNEYGQAMKKSFIGVEILNEGGGVSVDDLVLEEQYTYVCRGMLPWTKVMGPNQEVVPLTNSTGVAGQ